MPQHETDEPPAKRKVKMPTRLLLSFRELADLFGVSVRFLRDRKNNGDLPKPVYFGSLDKWRRDEIVAWINAGMPHSMDWEWHMANLPTLEQYVRQKHRELANLTQQIEEGERRVAELESRLNRRQ